MSWKWACRFAVIERMIARHLGVPVEAVDNWPTNPKLRVSVWHCLPLNHQIAANLGRERLIKARSLLSVEDKPEKFPPVKVAKVSNTSATVTIGSHGGLARGYCAHQLTFSVGVNFASEALSRSPIFHL